MNRALVVLNFLSLTNAYNIAYYDCGDINGLTAYRINGSCKHAQWKDAEEATRYNILQKRDRQRMEGFSCKVTRSTLTEYCGSFSHNKLAEPPVIEVNYPISPMTCLEMADRGVFVTPSGQSREIDLETVNIVHVEELGTINVKDNAVQCKGQSKRFANGQIVDEILQISQFKVLVTKERYIVDKGRIDVVDERLRLPRQCKLENHGCVTANKVYAYLPPPKQCLLEKARTVNMEEMDGYLVDTSHKILLRKGHLMPSLDGCPPAEIYATEYDNIFITESSEDFPALDDDLDVVDFISARDDYIVFFIEGLIQKQKQSIADQLCQRTLNYQTDEIIQTNNEDEFIRRSGDAIEHFHCVRKVAEIADNSESCYADIPLKNGFVKAHNRLFTEHSARLPCNPHFGLKVFTEEGVWIELNPKAKKIDEPLIVPSNILEYKHEDMSDGGLYTTAELESWKAHLAMPDYHDAVSKSISYGVCVHQGQCSSQSNIQPYDLGVIIPQINQMAEITRNFWTIIDEDIRACGTYISLAVILLEIVKLSSLISVIIITTMRDGVEGTKAVLYMLMCRDRRIAERVSRRHRRMKLQPFDATFSEDVGEVDVLDGCDPTRSMGPDL